ncbi:hypothetical protein AFERRI_410010 [Acidithiobacillus ferrivorans]|uniref:Uncharacterized protein n=1 Tax=Acidithiobacillus ferrivorans TaxID=160808 RepID=A0A060UPZ6_9PROT|nr:hypothetical protein AFERRI_410010 [Acidithiobacillus ferrivorans]
MVTLVRHAVAKGMGAFHGDRPSHRQYTTLFFKRRAREIFSMQHYHFFLEHEKFQPIDY